LKIAIVAPSPVPFVIGGAEKLWWGLLGALNQLTPHDADLIKLPSREADFWQLMESYRAFSRLDLTHFDLVISTKYPAWMVEHPNHYCYLQHKLRGLYDTYHFTGLPTEVGEVAPALRPLLAMMDRSGCERSGLEPFFEALFRLRDDPALPAGRFAFPGPLVRRIVHHLDAIALAPRSIRRYLAISRTVAARADYFPDGVAVTVVHHPSDLPRFESTGYGYLFSASRLVGPKRFDLLINAFRLVKHPVELRIAGTGPAEAALKALAQGDPRIRFLGHVSDEALIREYAGALFVPFVPYDEDYGLITVEAMASGKPVLTTQDSGGVNELVEHGVTGLSVAPEPGALADAMDQLIRDPAHTRAMGERARERVADIRWPQTVAALLAPPETGRACDRAVPKPRPKVVVAVDFPVYPPRGGGQARIYHLYKALARRADCVLVTLCDDPEQAGDFELAPGQREVRIAKSEAHRNASSQLGALLHASVGDIATLLHHDLTPDYARVLAAEAADCDLLVASHPYIYPVIRDIQVPSLWYEAHNVEYDMKRAVLGDAVAAAPYLALVRDAEGALCARADTVLVCAQADAERLAELYGIDPARCRLAPNGVDTRLVPYVGQPQRAANRRALGLDRPTLLFIGSWHQPNVEAVERLRDLAAQLPGCDLLVVGSVCRHPVIQQPPPNLHAVGELSDAELEVLLGAVDVALNPMISGSGTNLKMLHYAAAGVPSISTGFGLRGLALRNGRDIWLADVAAFADQVRQLLALGPAERETRTRSARAETERRYDWRIIADALPLDEVPVGSTPEGAMARCLV
jgi:glycosyltransferase involved in cell wall biosynthesis